MLLMPVWMFLLIIATSVFFGIILSETHNLLVNWWDKRKPQITLGLMFAPPEFPGMTVSIGDKPINLPPRLIMMDVEKENIKNQNSSNTITVSRCPRCNSGKTWLIDKTVSFAAVKLLAIKLKCASCSHEWEQKAGENEV